LRNPIDEKRNRHSCEQKHAARKHGRGSPTPPDDHSSYKGDDCTRQSWAHPEDAERQAAPLVKYFRDEQADRHVVAQTRTEHDAENNRDIEHRQRIHKTERDKTQYAYYDADVHDTPGTDSIDQITFDRPKEPRLDPRQRKCPRDRSSTPSEFTFEGRKERAHAKITKAGIHRMSDATGDYEPPFTIH